MKKDCPLREKLLVCQNCQMLPENQFSCFSKTALLTAKELLNLVQEETIAHYENEYRSDDKK